MAQGGGKQSAAEWWNERRAVWESNVAKLQNNDLEGDGVRERLRAAFIWLLREKGIKKLIDMINNDPFKRATMVVEGCLWDAWHSVRALRLPLTYDMEVGAAEVLTKLRYLNCRQPAEQGGPPTTKELRNLQWGWVGLLLRYSELLIRKLTAEEVDEETVMLATMTALMVRAIKSCFNSTFDRVPWDEVEFLLASFASSNSKARNSLQEDYGVKAVLATVATAARTLQHLKEFRTLVVFVHDQYREAGIKELEKLKKYPAQTRDDFLVAKLDAVAAPTSHPVILEGPTLWSATSQVYRDCLLLRDFWSLRKMDEALGVALDALKKQNTSWEQRDQYAFCRALFLLGELLNNTWMSPHLSSRCVNLIEQMSTDTLRKVVRNIRTNLKLAEEGGGGLLFPLQLTLQKKTELQPALQRTRDTLRILLLETLQSIARKKHNNEFVDQYSPTAEEREDGVLFYKLFQEHNVFENSVFDMIREEIKNSHEREAQEASQEVCSVVDSLENFFKLRANEVRRSTLSLISFERQDIITPPLIATHSTMLVALFPLTALFGAQNLYPAIALLRHYGMSVEPLLHFEIPDKGTKSPSQDSGVKALDVLQSNFHEGYEDEYHLSNYAREHVLGSLATGGDGPPVTDLASPVLFGRRLRNFLHHKDFLSEICLEPWLEIISAINAIKEKLSKDEEWAGASPRPRGPVEVQEEYDRLLELVRVKLKMFQCARSGNIPGLQKQVEKEGVDLASRDHQGRTLLHAAAAAKGQDAVLLRWLLDTGALDVDTKDWRGRTALHVAATGEAVRQLLMTNPDAVNRRDIFGCTPLHSAAVLGRTEVAEELLAERAEKEAKTNGESTPLHLAAINGHGDVVELLLRWGADCRAEDSEGTTPLFHSAVSGSVRCVRLLLGTATWDRSSDERFLSAVRLSAACGRLDEVQKLVAEREESVLEVADRHGRRDEFVKQLVIKDCHSAILPAAQKGHLEAFRVLLAELKRRGEAVKRSMILEAVIGRDLNIVSDLLDCNVPINWSNENGSTALHVAAQIGADKVARFLLERGADVTLRDKYHLSPVHLASSGGQLAVLRVLLDEVPAGDCLRTGGREANSPLRLAAASGHLEVVKELIEQGAEVNQQDNEKGFTALHVAAMNGHEKVIRLLIRKGADRWLAGKGKLTSLHYAAFHGRPAAVEALLDGKGIKRERLLDLLYSETNNGSTALHYAVISTSLATLKALLLKNESKKKDRHTALVYRRNKDGDTALQMAAKWYCSLDVIKELVKNMALSKADVPAMVREARDAAPKGTVKKWLTERLSKEEKHRKPKEIKKTGGKINQKKQ